MGVNQSYLCCMKRDFCKTRLFQCSFLSAVGRLTTSGIAKDKRLVVPPHEAVHLTFITKSPSKQRTNVPRMMTSSPTLSSLASSSVISVPFYFRYKRLCYLPAKAVEFGGQQVLDSFACIVVFKF